jgi:hypothetical protein
MLVSGSTICLFSSGERRGHGLRRPKWALGELRRRREIPRMLEARIREITVVGRLVISGSIEAEFISGLLAAQIREEDEALLGLSDDLALNEIFAE